MQQSLFVLLDLNQVVLGIDSGTDMHIDYDRRDGKELESNSWEDKEVCVPGASPQLLLVGAHRR